MKKAHLRSLLCSTIGFIALVVCTSTPVWWKVTFMDMEVYMGLWMSCSSVKVHTICAVIPESGWLNASRALMVLSCIFACLASIMNVFLLIGNLKKELIAATISAIPMFFACAGMAVYATNNPAVKHSKVVGYSNIVGWVGIVFGNMASITLFYSHYKSKGPTTPIRPEEA